MTLRCL
ncbi:putative membrane protein, partial [Escherichia coli 90.2281]